MTFLLSLPRQAQLILLLQFMNSVCTSMVVPMMSFFIVDGLGAAPWQVGFYTGLVLPLTLIANRWTGERIDNGTEIRRHLFASVAAYLVVTATLLQTSSLVLLLAVVAPLMSIFNTGSGIVFTFGRLYAATEKLETATYNSWLRMVISLAWMIGPALAFTLVAQAGFTAAFATTLAFGLVNLALWYWIVPRNFRAPPRAPTGVNGDPINWKLLMAAAICLGFVVTNSLFVSVMPLFFVTDQGLPTGTPGYALSVKCLVEVLVILGSVTLTRWISVRLVMMIAACLAAVSMVLFAQATSLFEVLVIALLEGTYYGLFAGVSITFVQSFAPDRPGRATAVYMNSLFLGGMIGSVSMGFIASATDYETVLYFAALSSVFALVLLAGTARIQPDVEPETA